MKKIPRESTSKGISKIYPYIQKLFFYTGSLYFFIAAYYYLGRSRFSGGDEDLFLKDLELIREAGWILAVEKNISIPYMILSYPFSWIFEDFVALRLTNVLLLLGFGFYLFVNAQEKFLPLYFYLSFYISAVGFYFYGTNDTLFFISLAVFLIEVLKILNQKKGSIPLALCALVMALFTRALFLVYLPVIFLGLFFLFKKRRLNMKEIVAPFILFLFFLFLNLPSLLVNKEISYDKKSSPKNVKATWTQRQYLSQLQQNNGEREFQTHPSWEETDAYLKTHGSESLPETTFKGMTHDIPFTIKEFFKDLFYVAIYHARTLGLIIVISLICYLARFIKDPKLDRSYFVPLSIITCAISFSLVVISHVELRWLGAIFLLAIVAYAHLETKKIIPYWASGLNYLILCIFSIYGTYGLILKIL